MSTQQQRRVRLSVDERRATVNAIRRLQADRPHPLPEHVQLFAERHGVTVRAVQKWLTDPALFDTERRPEPESTPDRFDVTLDDLTVLAQEQSARGAWRALTTAGQIDVSYPTFTRALQRVDPALLAAAKDGTKRLASVRLYAKTVAPHAGHTYHVDHTELDLWVAPTHRHTRNPVRPTVTVVVDDYSGFMWAFPWYQPINSDLVAAALVETCLKSECDGVTVGGIPEQVVLDNAGEHFAAPMRQATARLGITFNPTASYASYQNGKAERAIQLVNNLMSNRAPGAIHAGTTATGKGRHLESTRSKTNPETLLTASAFEMFLAEVVTEINTTFGLRRHHGLTRLQAWEADPTVQRYLPESDAWVGMLETSKETYRATKNGIWHRDRDYVCAGLEYSREYKIRYLRNRRDFIEVFTPDGERVGRAYDSANLPAETLEEFLREREAVEAQAKAVEQGVVAHRRHMAALKNAGAAEELLDTGRPPTLTQALADPDKSVRRQRPKAARVTTKTDTKPAAAKGLSETTLSALEARMNGDLS